jgi:hypothetical protein
MNPQKNLAVIATSVGIYLIKLAIYVFAIHLGIGLFLGMGCALAQLHIFLRWEIAPDVCYCKPQRILRPTQKTLPHEGLQKAWLGPLA